MVPQTSLSHAQWRRILRYLSPYKLPVILAVLTKMVASAMFLALPAGVQHIVDTALGSHDLTRLNQMTALLLGAFAVLTLASIAGNYYTNMTGERVVRDLRVQLYAHLQTLSLRFFNERRVGELISVHVIPRPHIEVERILPHRGEVIEGEAREVAALQGGDDRALTGGSRALEAESKSEKQLKK